MHRFSIKKCCFAMNLIKWCCCCWLVASICDCCLCMQFFLSLFPAYVRNLSQKRRYRFRFVDSICWRGRLFQLCKLWRKCFLLLVPIISHVAKLCRVCVFCTLRLWWIWYWWSLIWMARGTHALCFRMTYAYWIISQFPNFLSAHIPLNLLSKVERLVQKFVKIFQA